MKQDHKAQLFFRDRVPRVHFVAYGSHHRFSSTPLVNMFYPLRELSLISFSGKSTINRTNISCRAEDSFNRPGSTVL